MLYFCVLKNYLDKILENIKDFMMEENFDKWNQIKKEINKDDKYRNFKEKEIFYMKMGQNIGFEQNGKGSQFIRPVIVLKKFNKNIFFGIPTSSQYKEGVFYHPFTFLKDGVKNTNIALLSQMKLYSSNRLLNKIGMVSKTDFEIIKKKLKDLID